MTHRMSVSITTNNFIEACQFIATQVNEHSDQEPIVSKYDNTFTVSYKESTIPAKMSYIKDYIEQVKQYGGF